MSVVRVGSNEKYADNWDKIFSGGKGSAKATAKKSAKKAAPVKKAKKKAKKK
jgi:hypothetical protein